MTSSSTTHRYQEYKLLHQQLYSSVQDLGHLLLILIEPILGICIMCKHTSFFKLQSEITIKHNIIITILNPSVKR